MTDTVIRVEDLSKQYRLGLVGAGTLGQDLNRWWARMRGRPDPYLKVTESNDRASFGNSDFVWALRGINFEVKQGEVLGIIGRNGAGKSTLLKLLSRITAPTTGSVKVKGRIAALLEVGTGFHPELTGRENIYLNGAILGMSRAETSRKIDEIIAFSGCERYIDTPTKRYSSGMTVRLGFAVAAHLEPEILIVDEVLAVGDAEFQRKCIGKMQDVAGEGRTVLFVSHNMGSVRGLCQSGLVLVDGEVAYRGTSDDAVDFYLDASDTGLENQSVIQDSEGHGYELEFAPDQRESFRMGEAPEFKFTVRAPQLIEEASVGAIIHDASERPVVGASSFRFGYQSSGDAAAWRVRACFEQVPLLPGTYSTWIYFGSKGKDTLAKFRRAIRFRVEPTGDIPHDDVLARSWGAFYWKPLWSLEPLESQSSDLRIPTPELPRRSDP